MANQPLTSNAGFGSDVVVDMLQALGIEFVALNPGASYRGLHDSFVNYSNGSPEMILCNHEEIAVSIAHGYARAAGKPMAAAVHNIVGLLHATNSIYNAWLDQTGMLILGGTGPVATELRRPYIDWIHTALVQGNAVRDFVKWDDQPASVESIIDSMLRACQLITTAPYGPAYLCFDAGLQESTLESPPTIPDVTMFERATPPSADPAALARAADMLVGARNPVAVVDYLGNDYTVGGAVRLAESLGMALIDMGDLFNFPSDHPLNLTSAATELLSQADVVLSINAYDIEQALSTTDRTSRLPIPGIPSGAQVIDISLRGYAVRAWGQTYGKLYPLNVNITADPGGAANALADLIAQRGAIVGADERAARHGVHHAELRQAALDQALSSIKDGRITRQYLGLQTWEVVKGYDWVLCNRDLRGRAALRTWDVRHAYQYQGTEKSGLGNAYARSMGVALANRGTGRLNVNFQPDGDLLFTTSALWTAAHHNIPLLSVMHNNRSYNNDYVHQVEVAHHRDRPAENAVVGIDINTPNVDFATVARGFGVHAEGPIEKPEDLLPAIQRAAEYVAREGKPALVDVITTR
jgi:acetolactate synthase-1/2/3 large subunit